MYEAMAYYFKLDDDELEECINRNVHDKDLMVYSNSDVNSHCEPSIHYDFSKYVLVEFLDDFTPVKKLWELLGLVKNKAIIHKRLTVDPHRLKCRRAIIICVNAESAREIVNNLKGKKIIEREICAVVIEDLLADIKLFEKQIKKYGDLKTQEKLVYVSNLSKFRKPAVLVKFLNEKFSSFGTILSVLVSEGADGYALGEAVIRFSYFSEAFAAELAYDECVLGKERLSVAMQHNIILCECDLRVRLRDGLNAYQNRVGVGRLFRPSVNSTKSSLGSDCKIPLKNTNIAPNDKNIGGPSLTSHTSCVFSDINSHSLSSPAQCCNSSIELVRETPVNDSEENPLSNSTNICTVPETDSLLLRDNEKDSALQYRKEAITRDRLNACRNDELQLSDNSSSENPNRSWSSKLIGWVRSFVAKDDALLIEKDISNQIHSQPSKQSIEELFYSQCTQDTNWTGNEIESVPYLLLTRSISNLAGKNVSKLVASNTGKTKKINQRPICNVSDGNKSNAYSQNPLKLHGDVENCSPTKNRKMSKFRADQHAANKDEETLRLDFSSNHKTKGKNPGTEKRKKSKIYSKRSSFSNRSIMTRSKKKQSALLLSNEFNQNNATSNNLKMAELTISTKRKLKKRKDKLLTGFSTSNHYSVGMSTEKDKTTIASNDCSQQCSIQAEKDAILSQNATVSTSISNALLHADVNHSFHAYATIDSTGNSNITCQTIVNSTGVAVSSTEACFKEMQRNSVAENCHLSQHSTLENTLKQKNLPLSTNHLYARISSAMSTHRHDQHNSVSLSNECENSVASNSSISDSPIRAWLKEHLLCSVNNRVTTNEDNPEGIVFATMSKDVLISVGCSHMTCDVCYPGALNLIFGF